VPRPSVIDTPLGAYLDELEGRVLELESPNSPRPAYPCLKADLPAAASYINCVAYVTDTKILVASDGTVWRRQDTGAPI
jgi:hypothetical protein